MHADVDNDRDDQEADQRPAPEKTEAEIADEWLRVDGFYNWLLARDADPQQLSTKFILWLVQQYEREHAARERAAAAEREGQKRNAQNRARDQQARETLATVLAKIDDETACLQAVVAWLRSNPSTRFTCTDAALRARLEAVTPSSPDPDAVAWFLVTFAGQYELALGSWYTHEEKDEDTGKVVRRTNQFQPDQHFLPIAYRCARWAARARLLAAGQSAAEADAVLVHELTPQALLSEVGSELYSWFQRFNAPAPPEPAQPDPDQPEPRTVAARRTVDADDLEARVLRTIPKFGRDHHRPPRSVNEIVNNTKGNKQRLRWLVNQMLEDGRLAVRRKNDGATDDGIVIGDV